MSREIKDALRKELEEAKKENEVLRDENILYNKNYLLLQSQNAALRRALESFVESDHLIRHKRPKVCRLCAAEKALQTGEEKGNDESKGAAT